MKIVFFEPKMLQSRELFFILLKNVSLHLLFMLFSNMQVILNMNYFSYFLVEHTNMFWFLTKIHFLLDLGLNSLVGITPSHLSPAIAPFRSIYFI